MHVERTAVVHTSIKAPPQDLVAFLRDMETWKSWAPWIESVVRSSPLDWTLETEAGPMKVHFVEPNSFGILDHQVTLATGVRVLNAMRVLPNGTGSELVMVLFQSPTMSANDFERDIQSVTDDLSRLRETAEGLRKESGG
jgi:carbon monoxide dehydrogenase subunit G